MRACVYVGAAFIAGCAASQLAPSAPLGESAPATYSNHKTFHYIAKRQLFKVPRGVTRIRVVALGGDGGGSALWRGARVTAIIPVVPGETLAVYVGGNGTQSAGGFNGGGDGGANGFGDGNAYGGGGASDVREGGVSLKDRILVAAGGGGQGGWDNLERYGPYGVGGEGGKLTGGTGSPGYGNYYSSESCSTTGGYSPGYGGCPGTGGTQSVGGTGGGSGTGFFCYGTRGFDGSFGKGGEGAVAGKSTSGRYYECGGLGGGGGGGYYGGGGGGQGASYGSSPIGGGGGGGGGSSYVESTATSVRMWAGWRQDQHGLVVFSW